MTSPTGCSQGGHRHAARPPRLGAGDNLGAAIFALIAAAVIFFAAGAGGAAAGLALRAVALGRVTRAGR